MVIPSCARSRRLLSSVYFKSLKRLRNPLLPREAKRFLPGGEKMRWSTGIILFVDGDDEALKTIRESLTAVTDHVILHATTTQEAVAVLSRLSYYTVDLLVIDLELPDETGLGGIFGLLTTPGCRRKASKIIALAKTSRQDESFLGQVYSLGVDAVLPKPASAEQLVAAGLHI